MLRLFVEGAYGRTYDNADKVIADWCSNKDFKIIDGGPYLNASDVRQHLKPNDEIIFQTPNLEVDLEGAFK